MGFFQKRRQRKANKRRERLEAGNGFWMRYYRFYDFWKGRSNYRKVCLRCPIDPNLIVFEAFQGKLYTCSPKALYEEMLYDPAYQGYRFVWSFVNTRKHKYLTRNKRVTLVKRGSKRYFEVMATAKYRITNSTNARTIPVRKGQVYIQTWHGTPLKRLGLDIVREGNEAQSRKEIYRLYRNEAKQFTYLLSPSAYTTEKLSSAFGLSPEETKAKVIELGYPRNGALFTTTPEQVAELREFYGVPEGKKVILYAPTFRETNYRYGKGFAYEIALDMDRLRARFGDTACVLLRTHYLANTQFDFEKYAGFLIKVTGVADINRLYVISDLLITDYSSVMFDFSVLGRPMIFYMYDAEAYRSELRDFYIEPDILPGPIVTTQEALEDAISEALSDEGYQERYARLYEAFQKRFTYLDDKDAAKRVLAATVKEQRQALPVPKRLLRYRKRQTKLARFQQVKKKLLSGMLVQKRYPHYLTKPLETHTILLESQHGRAMDGNIYALLAELAGRSDYADYRLYLTAAKGKRKAYQQQLLKLGVKNVHVVTRASFTYFRVLATAKYLINDNTFIYSFVKREGQVYLNTWHGTPLKTLGRLIKGEAHTIGNTQKNFLAADYLLYPNEYTMEHMVEDYMLDNIAKGEVWLAGYPRNDIFFDQAARGAIRAKYHLQDKQVFAFLPTWRGTVGRVTGAAQVGQLIEYLTELDEEMPDSMLLYVKLHTVNNASFSTEEFQHIRLFPDDCETYVFLNATDGLITDYSSVMFDYAITKRRIILFTYDKEEYEAARGFYLPLSELPFPQAESAEELLHYMKSEKTYDESAFLQRFCPYDRPDTAALLCRKLLFAEQGRVKTCPIKSNGKRNVFVYGGALMENGITAALINLFSLLDTKKYNYTLIYKAEDVKSHPAQLTRFPEDVHMLGFNNGLTLSLMSTVLFKLFTKKGVVPYAIMEPIFDRVAQWDSKRLFTGCRVDKFVHFTGYSNDLTTAFRGLMEDKTIFVHSDMEKEVRTKNILKKEVLARAYQEYDSVAVVTEDVKEPAERIAKLLPLRKEKQASFAVVRNVINHERIRTLAQKELAIDPTTQINVTFDRLQEILEEKAVKFINIGRFSPEKGHFRLLSAFDRIHATNPDTYLIIIGGGGKLYSETLSRAQDLASYDHIVIIHYMSNPYALLKRCDFFVFTSFYEGFGLVLAEADICGVRCMSTDNDGARRFMQRYGGLLVDNSEQGIYDGMLAFLQGKVQNLLSVDYEEYNREAVAEFERLLPRVTEENKVENNEFAGGQ